MKAVQIAASEIALGLAHTIVAGGTESMSNAPFYLATQRWGAKFGHQEAVDGIIKDGLTDVYNKILMGEAAEMCADEYKFSREDQDNYAFQSYSRAKTALAENIFQSEIVPVTINDVTITADEEIGNVYLNIIIVQS
jgi:acetyl-CoA C-acetyltransferase